MISRYSFGPDAAPTHNVVMYFCYRASAIFVGVYEPMKRKLLDVFPDHLSSVAHLVRLGTGVDDSFHLFRGTCWQNLVCICFKIHKKQEQISETFLISCYHVFVADCRGCWRCHCVTDTCPDRGETLSVLFIASTDCLYVCACRLGMA